MGVTIPAFSYCCKITTGKAFAQSCLQDKAMCEAAAAEMTKVSDKDAKAGHGGASCGGGCFPGESTVTLKDGEKKRMSDLAIGDNVHVGGGHYSEVYYFSTKMPETDSAFVVLSTAETTVTLTDGHFVYLNGFLAEAGTATVGDRLTLSKNNLVSITNVSKIKATGLFNPHTLDGDIVVDGVLTSTYTSAVHPSLAHVLLMPLRMLYTYGQTSFGSEFSAATKGLPAWVYDLISANTTPLV